MRGNPVWGQGLHPSDAETGEAHGRQKKRAAPTGCRPHFRLTSTTSETVRKEHRAQATVPARMAGACLVLGQQSALWVFMLLSPKHHAKSPRSAYTLASMEGGTPSLQRVRSHVARAGITSRPRVRHSHAASRAGFRPARLRKARHGPRSTFVERLKTSAPSRAFRAIRCGAPKMHRRA